MTLLGHPRRFDGHPEDATRDWLVIPDVSRSVETRNLIEAMRQAAGVKTLIGRQQDRTHSRPRHIAMWLAKHRRPDVSLPRLGREFRRDHTTVLAAIRKLDAMGLDPSEVWEAVRRGASMADLIYRWPKLMSA